MTDLSKYPAKSFLQLIMGNPEVQKCMVEAKEFSEVVSVIDSLDVKYTEEQIELLRKKFK